jgi:hypothetical protein
MVEQERRTETIGLVPGADSIQKSKTVEIQVCGLTVYLPRVIPTNVFVICSAFIALIGICNSNLFLKQEQNNCLGILVFASILWAFEVLF